MKRKTTLLLGVLILVGTFVIINEVLISTDWSLDNNLEVVAPLPDDDQGDDNGLNDGDPGDSPGPSEPPNPPQPNGYQPPVDLIKIPV